MTATEKKEKAHAAYIHRRNRRWWKLFYEQQIDEITWNYQCTVKEANQIYWNRYNSLKALNN